MDKTSLPGLKGKNKIVIFLKPIILRIVHSFRKLIQIITPDPQAWKGSMIGLIVVITLLLMIVGILIVKYLGVFIVSGFILWHMIMGALIALGAFIGIYIFQLIPSIYRWVLVAVVFILFEFWAGTKKGEIAIIMITILSASFVGGTIWMYFKDNWKNKPLINNIINSITLIIGAAGIVAGSYWLLMKGVDKEEPVNAALISEYRPEQLSLPDPSEDGDYSVLELFYGSGKDKHREEFTSGINIKTDSVDGSRFVSGWEKFNGWARTKYWGIDEKSLPLNARVWYPGGKGPFPLVLIVHGNHLDRDFSDPGYEYLGKLMASRGFIFASVDENFLNSAWSNMFKNLKEENDCRAWLLLKHLQLWRTWNGDEKKPFFGKVDLDNIALIGHSRGGEAVAIAAAFNQLPYYPDDATVKFDFGFNIKSVIAIAPVDGQYKPGKIGTFFENVNYFVIQGSHDMDMRSYHGARQFQRIKFTDTTFHVKAGLYIWAANHGQFNSVWGENDVGYPGIALFNKKQLLPADQQMKIGKVFISAFLEATLLGKLEYLSLFRDYRTGLDWLPQTIFINHYEDSNCDFVCSFEEDLNLESITYNGGNIKMENLTVWKERMVPLKWGQQDTRAVYTGWNQEEKDSLLAWYAVSGPNNDHLNKHARSYLIFSMAESKESSNPYPAEEDEEEAEKQNDKNEKEKNKEKNAGKKNTLSVNQKDINSKNKEEEEKIDSLDLTIQVKDTSNNTAQLPLSHYAYLQPQLEAKLMKADFMTNVAESEIVFQTFFYPFKDFVEKNPKLDPASIDEIRFIFDRTGDGVVIIDNIGFWDPDN